MFQLVVKKCYSHYGRPNTAKVGREGGSTVGGPKAATSSRINQEQHKQHEQQPRNSEEQESVGLKVGGGIFPWNFVRFEAFLVIDFFGSLVGGREGKSIVKLFLTFAKASGVSHDSP